MAVQKMTMKEWEGLVTKSERHHAELLGDSPGGVAGQLGCSRQFVHSLIKRGLLDAVAVYEGRQLAMYMIPQRSIDAYKAKRAAYEKAVQARYTPA